MLKVSYPLQNQYAQVPSVVVSQNYDEGGTSVCLQSFNIAKNTFQVNAKNITNNTYYVRAFRWVSIGY